MTDIDTAALRRLAEAATPGPWSWVDSGIESGSRVLGGATQPVLRTSPAGWPAAADSAYIAAANPSAMVELLDRLAGAEAERDRLRAQVEDARRALAEVRP